METGERGKKLDGHRLTGEVTVNPPALFGEQEIDRNAKFLLTLTFKKGFLSLAKTVLACLRGVNGL